MSDRATKASSSSMKTDLDDWETDPDFVRDMDEIDQRWGSKRTVGSINMNELIDEVRKDHKIMREKFDHPSQRDYSGGFGGKFGIQHDRKDQSALDYNYHEKLSQHSSQEISRKIITSSSSSIIKSGGVDETKRTLLEKSEKKFQKSSSPSTNVDAARQPEKLSSSRLFMSSNLDDDKDRGFASKPRFEEMSSSKRSFMKEEKSAQHNNSGNLRDDPHLSPAFKSIQEKINAFKKEFDDMGAKQSELSKVIKKSSNIERRNNIEYITRSSERLDGSPASTRTTTSSSSTRPTTTSPESSSQKPQTKSSIKSLSEKFETLCREDGEDFRRKTEAKRREFFDQIKSQVRETRKELDGFDPIDDDEEFADLERKFREKLEKQQTQSKATPSSRLSGLSANASPSPLSRPSSRLSGGGGSQLSGSDRPKIYSRSETTKEEVVSRVVKENDKVIENETKRNVERSSSCHGSSDEDDDDSKTNSIKLIDQTLRSSPLRTESPIDRIKRETPTITPELKGAGLMARTLYDYQAAEEDELSFDVDDLITNIERIDPGWYKGTITYKDGQKQVGLFPANYVKLLNEN